MKTSNKTDTVNYGCGGFLGSVLTIIFVLAKILGYIDWSWWWVFAPTWGPIAFYLAIIISVAVIGFIVLVVSLWASDWGTKR